MEYSKLLDLISKLSNSDFINMIRESLSDRIKEIDFDDCSCDRHSTFSDEMCIVLLSKLLNN